MWLGWQVRKWRRDSGARTYQEVVTAHQEELYDAFARSGLQPWEFQSLMRRARWAGHAPWHGGWLEGPRATAFA
jgi:hypothetical protein